MKLQEFAFNNKNKSNYLNNKLKMNNKCKRERKMIYRDRLDRHINRLKWIKN